MLFLHPCSRLPLLWVRALAGALRDHGDVLQVLQVPARRRERCRKLRPRGHHLAVRAPLRRRPPSTTENARNDHRTHRKRSKAPLTHTVSLRFRRACASAASAARTALAIAARSAAASAATASSAASTAAGSGACASNVLFCKVR